MTTKIFAWTGGSTPGPYGAISRRERYLVSEVFREQAQEFVGRWGRMDWEDARMFWARARYDAHATVRHE